jgi:hypothetical protein
MEFNKKKMKKFWRLWAIALGSKANGGDSWYSDKVAIIRTLIVLQAVICNSFIVWSILKNN